jgi:hypothetical protein
MPLIALILPYGSMIVEMPEVVPIPIATLFSIALKIDSIVKKIGKLRLELKSAFTGTNTI